MKIKTGDKQPYAEFFYLDKENIVKIINTTDLSSNYLYQILNNGNLQIIDYHQNRYDIHLYYVLYTKFEFLNW